jgi:succinyl-CoA synthetase beta subunit
MNTPAGILDFGGGATSRDERLAVDAAVAMLRRQRPKPRVVVTISGSQFGGRRKKESRHVAAK